MRERGLTTDEDMIDAEIEFDQCLPVTLQREADRLQVQIRKYFGEILSLLTFEKAKF